MMVHKRFKIGDNPGNPFSDNRKFQKACVNFPYSLWLIILIDLQTDVAHLSVTVMNFISKPWNTHVQTFDTHSKMLARS